eukprot:CAMPEP_0181214790 /NCGR_PEP_ID=MMETSP1096-20121128/25655_1 /TAXON_ID=156174 ORGANISM="Chrysochromulina ericina, Strain CCMP281" /NCGR_SAMPLE_ID=MMETSP1096 /ASSEMBLY_ACC=CAM_ASM_000453 /LENGTH=85 /DNA_ID=CAMNT_0023306577 /DNA_START=235 /DNA_END=495 /DNA_ORIENTATION=+
MQKAARFNFGRAGKAQDDRLKWVLQATSNNLVPKLKQCGLVLAMHAVNFVQHPHWHRKLRRGRLKKGVGFFNCPMGVGCAADRGQ